MKTHNSLVKLAENDFRELKCFESKIFKKTDYKDFLYFGVMLLHEVKILKEESQKSWGGYNPSKPNQFRFRKFSVVKRNVLLGVGSEYLLKAIFLKNKLGINKVKNNAQLKYTYRLDASVKNLLDDSESVTFWYLKQHILKVVDCSEFDKEIEKENKTNMIKEKQLPKLRGIRRFYYKKPNSEASLNIIYNIRNNYCHNAFIKSEFNGFFEDAFKFLDFLTRYVFKKDIQQLFEENKPEEDDYE